MGHSQAEVPTEIFHDSTEEVRAIMGEKYLFAILKGGTAKTTIILTDRRIYQMGVVYGGNLPKFRKTIGRKILGIENVTGISMKSTKKPKWIFASILLMVLGLLLLLLGLFMNIGGSAGLLFFPVGLIIMCTYLLFADDYVAIDYAGGSILSRCSQFTEREIHEFQKAVSITKEEYINSERLATRPAPARDIYAEIEKLNGLKIKGIITETEFQTRKTKLLNE